MLSDEERRKRRLESVRKYNHSKKGLINRKIGEQSSKAKTRHRRYLESESGKMIRIIGQKRYNATDKAKELKRRYRNSLRLYMIKMLGSKCVICACDSLELLELDHIKNDGKQWRDRFDGEVREWIYYKTHVDELRNNLQILCISCHKLKHASKSTSAGHRAFYTCRSRTC